MDAKEYLQSKYPPMRGFKWNSNPNINDEWVAEMMESYHQSKQAEEAQERYDKTIDYMNKATCNEWIEALKIAAGLTDKTD